MASGGRPAGWPPWLSLQRSIAPREPSKPAEESATVLDSIRILPFFVPSLSGQMGLLITMFPSFKVGLRKVGRKKEGFSPTAGLAELGLPRLLVLALLTRRLGLVTPPAVAGRGRGRSTQERGCPGGRGVRGESIATEDAAEEGRFGGAVRGRRCGLLTPLLRCPCPCPCPPNETWGDYGQ